MTDVLNEYEILEELSVGLRNADILTTTERNVTTENITGTINGTSLAPTRTDIKNVRFITVNSTTLTPYTDYTIDYDSDSGSINQITFTSTQNGNYVVRYDYGSDRIHPDYARPHLDTILRPTKVQPVQTGKQRRIQPNILFHKIHATKGNR